MARATQQTHDQLLEHLKNQLTFLEWSAAAYDAGIVSEAVRIATVLRVLFKTTKSMRSLIDMLEMQDHQIKSCAKPLEKRSILDSIPIGVKVDIVAGGFKPDYGVSNPARHTRARNWWSEEIRWLGSQDRAITRGEYIAAACETAGGAHVDKRLDKDWHDGDAGGGFELLDRCETNELQLFTGVRPDRFGLPVTSGLVAPLLRNFAWEILTSDSLITACGFEPRAFRTAGDFLITRGHRSFIHVKGNSWSLPKYIFEALDRNRQYMSNGKVQNVS